METVVLMKIKVEKQPDHYRADCLDLPGSPPVGVGRTPELAVAALFYLMHFDKPSVHADNWMKYIKLDEPIIINDEVWSYPQSYSKR
jgi:hypothetical protein